MIAIKALRSLAGWPLFFCQLTLLLISLIHGPLWTTRPAAPRFAVIDVGVLYRLKEAQVTQVLLQADLSLQKRTELLEGVKDFGPAVDALVKQLPQRCHCVLIARAALVGEDPSLMDLTPVARELLGLDPKHTIQPRNE